MGVDIEMRRSAAADGRSRAGPSKKRNHEGKGDLASRGSRDPDHVISVADLGAEGEVGAAEVLGHHRRADQQEHRDDDEPLVTKEGGRGEGVQCGVGGRGER